MLTELGFIDEKSNEDIEMATELVTIVGFERPIKVNNLKTVLTAVLNFEFEWMLCSKSNKERTGTFDDDDNIKFSSKEVQQLHLKFFQLAQNR